MASSGQSVLFVYRYDPLDRLADCAPAGQGSTRLFYQKTHLATQIQGQVQHTLMRTDEHVLACLSTENNQRDGALLATDQQQSVTAAQGLAFAYTPYGHRHPSGPASLPGFTGQRVDPVTGHYLLGNGYRAFNPVLMRFNSPDSLSPFGEGGVNAYGYCGGDPVNRVDPTGHVNARILALIFRNRQALVAAKKVTEHRYSVLVPGSPTSSGLTRTGGVSGAKGPAVVPDFINKLAQPENVPAHLKTRRRLPAVPSDARLHTRWAAPKSSIAPRNIYHLPSGVVRRPKRIELPATPFQRVLTGDLPMDTIYEYPRLSRSKARALEVIRRGEMLRRDHSYSSSVSVNFRQSDPTSSVNIAVRF
ncbi:RHS repeat-associated core domain-containing protein [Pseudomonas syringae]|uniref:RHS repeat-associated core domain-containing protein n=1 Tax=Pseudomonas syringae TaxID=317 RepID=UPI0006E5504F|nr:RHS repeat-associated core domain-containing protein [Pseudomonas syringae]KPY31286.1 YD repeat-containing protein-containing protein-containing protein [Pseudomonas syringae pv. papulans]RMN44738.1 YD repeat-containing protein-containing protein-containing protein [Pseudomonas syringae pv. papulans]RMN78085.1 YD repeat-containing protein-containing protein-containing protein [Pseudomonas syringae pv. papulans]RMV40647.1 YD repeat-containing protein-containing protein-containing protein [Pse